MSRIRYFDSTCPNTPFEDEANIGARNAFISQFLNKWPENSLDGTQFDVIELGKMLSASPFLQRLALKHSKDIIVYGEKKFIKHLQCIKDDFVQQLCGAKSDNEAMQAIRFFRGRSSLAIALSDLKGQSNVATQSKLFSEIADTAVVQTVKYLFQQAKLSSQIPSVNDDLTGCGWTILALGKLGAEELNFSSDIDLIILHDNEKSLLEDKNSTQPFFVSMARKLIRLLSTTTSDGIGWRVDLRLRPDPSATAVSIDLNAAITYYESIARTWERAAFIRARPIAGDITLGKNFITNIQPFVWRKTLDYTVIDDMKIMLSRSKKRGSWYGFNLKTGENGIRQIEFFTHVLQLVSGGRDTTLRQRNTKKALQALAKKNWITKSQSESLIRAYFQLRRIEHRLQMVSDNQTHTLPRSDENLLRFANFMGHKQSEELIDSIETLLKKVENNLRHDIFQSETSDFSNLNKSNYFLLDDYDELLSWLNYQGFKRPKIIADTLSGWIAGRIPATRSDRARSLMNHLLQEILINFTTDAYPDEKFAAFAQFIEGLPASVQIFSLLRYNPHLSRLLCDILVLSPHLGNHLRQHPMLFDLLLYSSFFEPLPDTASMVSHLRKLTLQKTIEDALDTIKIQTREWKFQIQVQFLSQTIKSIKLGEGLGRIAEATITLVLDLARADMIRRHGNIDAEVVVVALGRLGAAEMTVTSDIDLVILYDGRNQSSFHDKKPLNIQPYFIRLAQTFTNWLSTPTSEGTLYEVDTRLRPEGKAGSIATSFERFTTYFKNDAWLWERIALTKARPVAGDRHLTNQIEKSIHTIINQPYNKVQVSKTILQMLTRVRTSLKQHSKWHIKTLEGGLIDLDLLIRGLLLSNNSRVNSSGQTALKTLGSIASAGQIGPDQLTKLSDIVLFYDELNHSLRTTSGDTRNLPDDLPASLSSFLMRRLNLNSIEQLTKKIELSRETVSILLKDLLSVETGL